MKESTIFDAIATGQAEQGYEQLASLLGTYYGALLAANIPEELAQSMVMDYSSRFWALTFANIKNHGT